MKYIFIFLLLILFIPTVLANNITVIDPISTSTIEEDIQIESISTQTVTNTPTITPEPTTPTPAPTIAPIHFIYQGESVYLNDTIDISGVVPPYPYLAYWNGYDMYDTNASYIIDLPPYKSGYYHFYLDPSIFSTRLGRWYKYGGSYEKNSNNLAFIVKPQTMKNSTLRYSNGTLVNISETVIDNYTSFEIPIQPPVEIKHVSDYLIARGDPFSIKVNATTNIWLFGRSNQLLDYKSTNTSSIDIPNDILSGFEPGNYIIELQTVGNTSTDFTVKYDPETQEIKWFDPTLFTINKININGLSPQVLLEKFKNIIPLTIDTFKTYKLELQEPYIEIRSINEQITLNETIDYAGVTHYNTNVSFIQIKGYTNVAIGSVLKFVLDEKQQTPRTLRSYTTTAVAGGSDDPGDMRWFDVVVPVNKYNLALGPHTVTAYTNLSTSGTVYTFNIYESPKNSYVEPHTIRYIAGRNGPEEFVPTPTPITIIETVTQVVTVPVTITIPVTPSNEQIKAQQKIIADENINKWGGRIVSGIIIIGIIWYLISLYLRGRELK